MKVYKVYLIREKKTHRIVYAGITRTTINKRFTENTRRFKKDRNLFYVELVTSGLDVLQAAALERMLIAQYNLIEVGWNSSPGSINGFSNNHSEKLKQKWSKERKGKPVSPEHSKKNRVARLGKKNSPQHNKRISEVKSKPVLCIETGEVYRSGRAAAKALGLQPSKVSNVCHGKRKSTGGYTFRFV